MGLHDTAARLAAAGAHATDTAAALSRLDPGARPFGADAPGHLGVLGRDLHRGCLAAIEARAREAAALGARLDVTAAAVERAAAGYAEADASAGESGRG